MFYIQYVQSLYPLPEAHSIRADGNTAARGPDGLLTNRSTSMSSVDHSSRANKDADVSNLGSTVATSGPEKHITSFGLGTGDVLAHLGVVLLLGCAGNSLLLSLADGVLGET